MIPNPHSRRFDPRCFFTATKTVGEELFESLDAYLRSAATDWTNDPDLRDFDQALEQIVLEECRVCPLCGEIVDRVGTVVNLEKPDPEVTTILKKTSMTTQRLSRWTP